MNIYTTLHIGEFHTLHCEDFLVVEPLGTITKLIAVMDGCSMGKESVFASVLFGKILRKIAKNKYYQEMYDNKEESLEELLKEITHLLFEEAIQLKNKLGLETEELLATLILAVVNVEEMKAEMIAVGDGLICVDGNITEYEQNDKPDYFGYHLNEDFETWYQAQEQKLSVIQFQELSICTDGIFSFKDLTDKKNQKSEDEIIDYLLVNQKGIESEKFFDKKIKRMKDEWNHWLTDDLAIIRLVK